jgi:hypothetical protein
MEDTVSVDPSVDEALRLVVAIGVGLEFGHRDDGTRGFDVTMAPETTRPSASVWYDSLESKMRPPRSHHFSWLFSGQPSASQFPGFGGVEAAQPRWSGPSAFALLRCAAPHAASNPAIPNLTNGLPLMLLPPPAHALAAKPAAAERAARVPVEQTPSTQHRSLTRHSPMRTNIQELRERSPRRAVRRRRTGPLRRCRWHTVSARCTRRPPAACFCKPGRRRSRPPVSRALRRTPLPGRSTLPPLLRGRMRRADRGRAAEPVATCSLPSDHFAARCSASHSAVPPG